MEALSLRDVTAGTGSSLGPDPRAGQPFLCPHSAGATLATIDHERKLSAISPDATGLLGWRRQECLGMPIQALVYPKDVPILLLALGRSSADGHSVATRLRVSGHHSDWTPLLCEVSPLCEHNPPRFALAMWPVPTADETGVVARGSLLEGHLWRIAMEVRMAGVVPAEPEDDQPWWGDPDLRDLTLRQFEILRRLVAGESTSSIASALVLSPSTVRNHLSAIYRRLGVGSQVELLRRLRRQHTRHPASEPPAALRSWPAPR
jgi:DNA-binding CsgD family transcriptional regulator